MEHHQPGHDCAGSRFLSSGCSWPACACSPTAARHTRRTLHATWRRRLIAAATAAALAAALWHLGQAGYIQAKALLAQFLIHNAWAETRPDAPPARPWPWADTWPVARLRAAAQRIDLYVLAGADDRSLAFGPGHVYGTPLPGEPGNSVIGGHRDTHFAFLQWLENGDEIEVETPDRSHLRYRVAYTAVVDKDDLGVLAQPENGTHLTLVTCYPFNALRAGGPLRYVVIAQAVDGDGRVLASR